MPDLQTLLDQIEQADGLATPGPWEESTNGVTMNDRDMWRIGHPNKPATFNAVMRSGDALFIALSRTAMPALAQAAQEVLALHRPETRWSYEPEPEYSFRTRPGVLDHFGLDGEPYNPSHISQWQICAYCAEVEQGAAEDLGHLTALWPCTTYKTITEALGDDDA